MLCNGLTLHCMVFMLVCLSLLAIMQESKEATNYYFCYRWLLILFKREFTSYEEVRFPHGPSNDFKRALLHVFFPWQVAESWWHQNTGVQVTETHDSSLDLAACPMKLR